MNTPDTEKWKGELLALKHRGACDYASVYGLIEKTRQEAILEGQRRAVGYLLSKLPKLNKMFGGETYYTLPESLLEQARTLPVTEK